MISMRAGSSLKKDCLSRPAFLSLSHPRQLQDAAVVRQRFVYGLQTRRESGSKKDCF
jgi:hypothetical protein